MPVLRYYYCPKCNKDLLFRYIPLLTLEDSYWKCPNCNHRIYNDKSNFYKKDLTYGR